MKETVQQFGNQPLAEATLNLFRELNIPVNKVNIAGTLDDFLGDDIRVKESEQVGTVTLVGSVDDKVFANRDSDFDYREVMDEKQKYDGLIILCVELKKTDPTRTFLSNITRALNRSFHTSPVVVLFKYGSHISLANAERMQYKQKWREGEKVGKVSLLRDIRVPNPHSGHLRILRDLRIDRSGSKKVDSYSHLYKYWQTVFDVSVLNKKFFQELSNWYFWAIRNVTFPEEPVRKEAEKQSEFKERLKTHRAQNVIRLITRLIFTWFVKEKKLVPQSLFEKEHVSEIIKMDNEEESNYYKAVLQNLFFATFNQEMDKREFRNDGQNYNVTTLYRYRRLFKNPETGLELFRDIPFLNGGLFECLDKPDEKGNVIRVDGFSDRDDNELSIPNYLFFGKQKIVDLSEDYGKKTKKYKEASTQGLFNILNRYVFTITENTPLEEDVALDPELLGKVFENLLASYNPETKTTARKQTGSFYTPREIVNYMVDESMIAYLKKELTKSEGGYYSLDNNQGDLYGNTTRKGQLKMEEKVDSNPWEGKEDELEEHLRGLFSYEDTQPFEKDKHRQAIIHALDNCKVLDPACGSGAFPMGILQKMVHVLKKLDPDNKEWKERQISKAESLDDPKIREDLIQDIEEAFENNELDFGRKLYLIENCIYGVDIQPIAVQIAKLRFFISLVVDQNLNENKENLGIRPLPNLETRFVAANTLVSIKKPDQLRLRNPEIERLEKNLERVRHHHFSAKTPKTKRKWRERDKEIREEIAELLRSDGWGDKTAQMLSDWDPYDQNFSSSFFDPEWMFGVTYGFDVIIGNPPYINVKSGIQKEFKNYYKAHYKTAIGQFDYFSLFIEKSLSLSKILSLIVPKPLINNENYEVVRKSIIQTGLKKVVIGSHIFDNTGVESCIFITSPSSKSIGIFEYSNENDFKFIRSVNSANFKKLPFTILNTELDNHEYSIIDLVNERSIELSKILSITRGVETGKKDSSISKFNNSTYKLVRGEDVSKYQIEFKDLYIDFDESNTSKFKSLDVYESPKLCIRRVSNEVIAAIDEESCITLNTIYNCHFVSAWRDSSLYLLQAILNSKLINYWFKHVFISTDELFPYLRVSQLEKIPISKTKRDKSIELLSYLRSNYRINQGVAVLDDVINGLVFELYLSDEMDEGGINISHFVRSDVEEVLGDFDYMGLKDMDKQGIIENLCMRWTHPDSEVRNRIKLFSVRSPDILKPILQG